MDTKEIATIINLLGNQGLGFFALYILYHYANQLLGTVVIMVLAKRILNIIEKWLTKYLEPENEPENESLKIKK